MRRMVVDRVGRAVLVVAMLACVGASDGQDGLERYRTQMANMSAQPSTAALSNPALASAIAEWKLVGQTDALPFDRYATFLLAHPGWPGEARARAAAEKQAGAAASPTLVAAFFDRFPPQTGAAGVRYAVALAATGRQAAAAEAARAAWRRGALSAEDEGGVLAQFAPALTPADQDARMDALLWQGQAGAAARQLALVSPAHHDLFAARVALRANTPQAATFATADPGAFGTDAGYVIDRASFLRGAGEPSARAWLAKPRDVAPPSDPTRYLQALLSVARGCAADGQWQLAYQIAQAAPAAYPPGTDIGARSYAERDAWTDLAWIGGQAAYAHLGRPADGIVFFERYAAGSRSPSIRSKGLYWAARAAEAGGLPGRRAELLTRAAAMRDQYYGQLAAERLGQALVAPPPLAPRPVDPATRAAFLARQTVQAATLLGQIGDRADQTAFVRQIAQDASSDADHVLAAELSRTLSRPDLAVMVGRSALANGLPDYSLAGFPQVSLPADEEGNRSIIHAIARQESQFDREATSRTGARGLMQLMPGTARDSAGKLGVAWDAGMLTASTDYNVHLGSYYFQHIYGLYGSWPLAIAAYNAGPGNVRRWIAANGDPRLPGVDPVAWVEAIPFSETRNYVQRVLENAVVYDLIDPTHAKSPPGARLSWYLGKGQPG